MFIHRIRRVFVGRLNIFINPLRHIYAVAVYKWVFITLLMDFSFQLVPLRIKTIDLRSFIEIDIGCDL